MSATVARVEEALQAHGAKGGRGSWTCPAHEDRSPSLTVKAGGDGRALVHCFAGCEVVAVVEALGLSMRDLFDGPRPETWTPAARPRRWDDWAPPKPYSGRMGLPTWDDVFWAQADEVIDAHFAQLLAAEGTP